MKPVDLGPKLWYFLSDLLDDPDHVAQLELILAMFDHKDPLNSWKNIKLKIQSLAQKATAFCQKQQSCELQGLKHSFKVINKKIF